MEKFYQTVYTSLLRHLPFNSLKAIVIASPGFTKDSLYDYIFAEATRTGNKTLLTARNKFVRVHVSSPHVHSLVEALKSPEVREATKTPCIPSSALTRLIVSRWNVLLDHFATEGNKICARRNNTR